MNYRDTLGFAVREFSTVVSQCTGRFHRFLGGEVQRYHLRHVVLFRQKFHI